MRLSHYDTDYYFIFHCSSKKLLLRRIPFISIRVMLNNNHTKHNLINECLIELNTQHKNSIIKALQATDEKLKYMQQQVFIIKVIMEAELGDAQTPIYTGLVTWGRNWATILITFSLNQFLSSACNRSWFLDFAFQFSIFAIPFGPQNNYIKFQNLLI